MFNTLYYCTYIFQYLNPSIIYMGMYIRIKQCLGTRVCVCLSVSKNKQNMFQASYVAKVFQTSYSTQSILIRTFIVLGVSQYQGR